MRTPWTWTFDLIRFWFLPTHQLRREWWGGCSMGPSLDETKDGRIIGLWTSPHDSPEDQKGLTYAKVRFEDGSEDRFDVDCLYFDRKWQRYVLT